ncbi:ubinuclein-2a isoform 2-T2 [Odontesthes bonariensis]|uniref:ubinuclein-2a isoform X2 n=1 Tax=Odontesthes bonariensis TaxID=219752 RepID=UPI003F58A143
MAEPRKVQFVTLSAFAAGAAGESRKRRLDGEADFNFGRAAEVEANTGAEGTASDGRLVKTDDKDKITAERRATVRLNLCLSEPSDRSSAEFNYGELIQSLTAKSNLSSLTSAHNPNDPFNSEERERLQVEALAKKFENKYGNTGKKKKKDRMQDLIDIGFGYDETDPFIDNSEAYDELVPASLTTKLGGFYINTGTLQFRAASDSEGEDKKLNNDKEQVIKRRKKKDGNNLEEKNVKKNKVPKQGVTALTLHRPEKKRKKLMKDSLYLAAMLRRFTREKEDMKKTNPSMAHLSLPGGTAIIPHTGTSTNLPLGSNSTQTQGSTPGIDLSLADLTSDPAVMSLLGSANEKDLQDLLVDLDFSVLDNDQQHAMVTARENGILGVGVPSNKALGGGAQGRGLGSSSGLFSPRPLPEGLPAPLIKRIEDLRAASRQFDQEGRKKFFTLDMNNILLDIELQVQEQPPEVRSDIYSHMEAFVPCNKEALLKRLKKLSLNIQDDRLRTPLLKLKLAVCSVMPEQISRYNMDCMAKAAKQQSEEGDKNGSEEEDEEKPGKRVMGPRKKFIWDDKLRNLLCSLVRVKLSCYEMENQCSLSVEDYLKAFLENEVKPLWPKGWMQARILLKESLAAHNHLTGNLVKRRVVPGPKAKAKEGLWIHKPPLTMTSTPSLLTSTSGLASSRQPPSSSPSEPICLSDSLDEDLTAPSLDSISHALALLSNASKGLGLADSPLSPPPLQVPTSSPPPVTPHYPSASQLSASVASTMQQHSASKVETTVSAGSLPTITLTNPSSTSSSSSPVVSSVARAQASGLSLTSRTADGHYGQMKGSGTMSQVQTQRHVTMASPNHRPSSVMGKMHPHPSPSPPKPRPPPTASPLLPPQQKSFASPVGILGAMGNTQGLSKSGAKAGGISSNGSIAPSSSQSRSNSTSHHVFQSFCSPSPVVSSPSPALYTSHSSQGKSHTHHHHHQPNFITPMQATLTKSSHSSNSSPIIKLTPRPPAPTPPPSSSPSPSPSPSPSHQLSHQMIPGQQQQHQYSPKTSKTFRAPFSVSGGGPVKQTQGVCSFAGGHKAQSTTSNSSINNSNNKGVVSVVCSHPDKTAPPSTTSILANHGQRQRMVGGASQGSKAGNGWVASGTLATSSTTSHLSQVSAAGSPLLSSHSALPLGFGMIGGLVPVSLPFQYPSLLNFSAPGAPGTAGMSSAPSSNSGYPLAQSDLMDLYKSLQSGSQAALPPHLQLAFSDSNQSQGGDTKRKTH